MDVTPANTAASAAASTAANTAASAAASTAAASPAGASAAGASAAGASAAAPGLPASTPELLPEPRRLGVLSRLAPEPMKVVLNWGRRYSLWVFNFGLACCAIEFIAASMARHDFIRLGVIPFAPGPRQADLMIVSGTVTDKMAPAVKRLYEQMPEPKYVISFGACSNCGGPYWDSYSVTKGVDQIIPVDVYVPGCPPRPEALLQGILKLQETIARESLGERYAATPAVGGTDGGTGPKGTGRASAAALRSGLVEPPPAPGAEPTEAAAAAGTAATEDRSGGGTAANTGPEEPPSDRAAPGAADRNNSGTEKTSGPGNTSGAGNTSATEEDDR